MKPFKTIDEQIQILKSRGLNFENEDAARKILMHYGYYEIVNGYNKFLLSSDERYRENEKFEHLFAIYRLDRDLQNNVLHVTLEIESLLKTSLSYFIAKEYGHDEKDYLKRTNYKSGRRLFFPDGSPIKDKNGQDLYEIDSTFRKFKNILKDNIEPFRHYREDHGHIPPWILFKGCSFGNIRHFYQLQTPSIKDSVMRTMMGFPEEDIFTLPESAKKVFSDAIFVAQKFRNRAAHGGRIVGYRVDSQNIQFSDYLSEKLNITEEQFTKGYGNGNYYSLFAYLQLFDDKRPLVLLSLCTKVALDEHFKLYPEDRVLIFESLGFPPQEYDKSNEDIFIGFASYKKR